MTSPTKRLPLVVTPGEPAGIGAEIAIKAWHQTKIPFCMIESPGHIRNVAKRIGMNVAVREIGSPSDFDIHSDKLQIIPINWPADPQPGKPDTANAPSVIQAIAIAASWSLAGDAAGMITNPIQKSSLYDAGFTYPGHTEFLATFGNVATGAPLMMLACDELRVVPATVHIPLKDVSAALSERLIVEKACLMETSLRQGFGISKARIAICGLNPHAGEDGSIGLEDIEIISTAIETLQTCGINATGPHPADSLFHPAARRTYDAVLGMYHDQVLIPLKTIDFHGGVNVTLGLDFIRTSPDHGTGLSISGQGIARPDSLIAAINMADQLASRMSSKTNQNSCY
jgi:4-hydroxythreonine-4-phosphate dehydrogenase